MAPNETPDEREKRLAYHRAYYATHREKQLAKQAERNKARRDPILGTVQTVACVDCSEEFETMIGCNRNRRSRCDRCHRAERTRVSLRFYETKKDDPDFRARAVERARVWANENRERVAEIKRDWTRRNPESARIIQHVRRSRVKAAGGRFTVKEFRELCAWFDNRCAYCGASGKMTMDHIVPIAHGGSNWISNILPACRLCNYRKGARSVEEFAGVRLAA